MIMMMIHIILIKTIMIKISLSFLKLDILVAKLIFKIRKNLFSSENAFLNI